MKKSPNVLAMLTASKRQRSNLSISREVHGTNLVRAVALRIVFSVSVSAFSDAHAFADPIDCDTILARYREIILERPLPEIVELQGYLKDLSSDGTWPDLNYADKHPSGWSPKEHLYRIRWLAQILASNDQRLGNSSLVSAAVDRSLDHWLAHRYRCPNWWWNEIGTPQVMRDIAILLGDRLDARRKQGAIDVISQLSVHGSGANLLWSAELAFHRACLVCDQAKMAEAVNRAWAEIRVVKSEGIQSDWSFHQHGPRLHSFGYGRSYLDVAVNLACQLRDTSLAIPDAQRTTISNFVLEGLQWMSRRMYCPPGTFDRVVSRQHSKEAAMLVPVLRRWSEVDGGRRDEIVRFMDQQQGRAEPPLGFRHFPRSDFSAYHHPNASIFLKTISDRTTPTESIIGENLKGVPFLNCGDYAVVRDGREYTFLQPVLEWNHLPGLTVPDGISKQERTPFVGGLGNGGSGMVAMDYVRTADEKKVVSLRKAWFFHEDAMICLIGGPMPGESAAPAVTSLEQCRLQGVVNIGDGSKSGSVLAPGNHPRQHVNWILHNGVGYIPPSNSPIDIYVGPAKGSWSSINSRYHDSPESVTEEVFRVQTSPSSAVAPGAYAVIVAATADSLNQSVHDPGWQIVRIDRACQAVRFTNGTTMAAFYEPMSFPADIGPSLPADGLKVDRPCLAIWSSKNLWACDPTNQGGPLKVIWNGNQQLLELPAGGVAAALSPP